MPDKTRTWQLRSLFFEDHIVNDGHGGAAVPRQLSSEHLRHDDSPRVHILHIFAPNKEELKMTEFEPARCIRGFAGW